MVWALSRYIVLAWTLVLSNLFWASFCFTPTSLLKAAFSLVLCNAFISL